MLKRFLAWMRNPTPQTTLISYLRRKWKQADEEAIRLEAYYLWEADGKPDGRSEYYYHKAVQKHRGLWRRIVAPFIWVEKRAIEPVSHWMNRADLFNILEKVGILIAVFIFAIEYGSRREKAIYEAWTVVNDAQEEKTGVVALALERLHREKFSLVGIDAEKTDLFKVDLKGANLGGANLEEANLIFANLKGVNLNGSNLKRAELEYADLEGAYLVYANLEGADLKEANLKGASLSRANLKGANLKKTNLEGVTFCETIMPDGTVKTHKPDCPKGWG